MVFKLIVFAAIVVAIAVLGVRGYGGGAPLRGCEQALRGDGPRIRAQTEQPSGAGRHQENKMSDRV